MKYIQLIYCSKPICSSLADQAKNDHRIEYNSNHGKKKNRKKTDNINVYRILTKIGEFELASDKKYMTKNEET